MLKALGKSIVDHADTLNSLVDDVREVDMPKDSSAAVLMFEKAFRTIFFTGKMDGYYEACRRGREGGTVAQSRQSNPCFSASGRDGGHKQETPTTTNTMNE